MPLRRTNVHGYHPTDDAVAGGVGQEGRPARCSEASRLLQPVQPQGLHAASAIRADGAGHFAQARPPRHCRRRERLVRRAPGVGFDQSSASVHPLQGAAAPAQKSLFHQLLDAVFDDATEQGLVGDKEQASVDSTGMEAGHRSAHYAHRTGQKRYRLRRWPKLTLAFHNATHLLIHALVTDGPSQDAPLLRPVLRGACRRVNIDQLLTDAGFDAEHNHVYAREQLGIRSTVINLNKRGGGRRWAKTKYRRQMYRRFPKVKYRQRAQAESGISRFKRRLTSSLRGRSRRTQRIEVHLRVLTHDLLLLAA
jgi:hypothetical protein